MIKITTKIFAIVLCCGLATTVAAHSHKTASANIVETAAGAGQFETLLAAATAAGLVPALTGEGPLTVFAPTDEAFGALPAGTIDTLLKEENKDLLVRILSYHVVAGSVGSDALANNATLDTLAGPKMTFTQTEQGFSVEGARIVATDVQASNGIVHIIDRVIMPPEQMSRADAVKMITSSIAKGVPMFNHGNHSATAAVYTRTAKTLLMTAQLTPEERARLQKGLTDSEMTSSAPEQAWRLRYALDDVMDSLHSNQTMMTYVR